MQEICKGVATINVLARNVIVLPKTLKINFVVAYALQTSFFTLKTKVSDHIYWRARRDLNPGFPASQAYAAVNFSVLILTRLRAQDLITYPINAFFSI